MKLQNVLGKAEKTIMEKFKRLTAFPTKISFCHAYVYCLTYQNSSKVTIIAENVHILHKTQAEHNVIFGIDVYVDKCFKS